MLSGDAGRLQSVVKISVIIVTYNAADTLQKCLESIFCLQYPNLELIVMDGNSTDDTIAILKKNAHNITYWKSQKDEGIYHAMNLALQHATGSWIYFLGADDELLPGFLSMAKELTDQSAVYYGNVFSAGAVQLGRLTRYQLAKFGIYHQAMIYPKAVFDNYSFDTRYKISADFALTLQLCGDSAFHFVYKDFIIANFNHTGISGTQVDLVFQKDKAMLICKNFGRKTWLRYKWHKLKNRSNPRA